MEHLVGQITQSNGNAVCLAGNVTDEDYAAALVDLAETRFGGLDGAFNNAGIMGSVPEMDTKIGTMSSTSTYPAHFLLPRHNFLC